AVKCRSGFTREAGDAVGGTGFAGVRGKSRSYMGQREPEAARSM
ncbi:hypothetical protein IAE39_005649, partial [Pseudomonas sp. S37]|nr:hypothetical protein [Pseudomonas sp. S37]